jgi:hypothetical protein
LSGLCRKLRHLQSTATLQPHLRASFSRYRVEFFYHRRNIYLPHQNPHFHCSSLLSKFKPSLMLIGSSASSPVTLLLAAPPPRRLPFFLQRRLLAGDPSSCCAASSPLTLLLAARPRRYGQVIHTPPTPSSSFPVPHAPTDGATPSTEITAPSSN